MADTPWQASTVYNAVEIILWSLFAVECQRRGLEGMARPVRAAIASVAFLLFAASDAVEISTGAWWKPWWLFVWKASCVLTLVGLASAGWMAGRRGERAS